MYDSEKNNETKAYHARNNNNNHNMLFHRKVRPYSHITHRHMDTHTPMYIHTYSKSCVLDTSNIKRIVFNLIVYRTPHNLRKKIINNKRLY